MDLRQKVNELTQTYGNKLVGNSKICKGASSIVAPDYKLKENHGLGDLLTTPVTAQGIGGIAAATYLTGAPIAFFGSAFIDNDIVQTAVALSSLPGLVSDIGIASFSGFWSPAAIPFFGYMAGKTAVHGYQMFQESIQRQKEFEKTHLHDPANVSQRTQ